MIFFWSCRFRNFTKVQENLVLLQNILHSNACVVLTERSLTAWIWNLPFNAQIHDCSQADWDMWRHKLGVWVYDITLKLGWSHVIWDISVHAIDMNLLFIYFFIKIWIDKTTKFQLHCWLCGIVNDASGFVIEPWNFGDHMQFKSS